VLNIPAYCQRLYHNEAELVDDRQTVHTAGIVFDSVVSVMDISTDLAADMEDVVVIPKSQAERAAGGFHNTLLHGLDPEPVPIADKATATSVEENRESPQDVVMETNSAEVRKGQCSTFVIDLRVLTISNLLGCGVCTYLNEPDYLVCEMCDNTL
jgi:hypothetical protein